MTTRESASPAYSFYPFSTSTLNDILGKFSELSLKNILLGYVFMVSTLDFIIFDLFQCVVLVFFVSVPVF